MKNKIIIAIIVIVALGACGLGLYHITDNSNVVQPQVQPTEDVTATSGIQVLSDGKLVSYEGIAGETALITLKKLAEVEATSSSLGEFVTSIDGLAADSSKNEFWAFYVNGQSASVGAGSYNSIVGDKIEWKLESF